VDALKPAERIVAQSREPNLKMPRVPAAGGGGGAAAGGATGAVEGVGEGDGDGVGVGEGEADCWTGGDEYEVGLVRARAESCAGWCGRDRIEIVAAIEPRATTARRPRRMGSRAGPAVVQLRNLIAAA
jgi:hypothetical protein